MNAKKRRFVYLAEAGLVLAGICLTAPAFAQNAPAPAVKNEKIAGNFQDAHILPPGGPPPRMADGHVDLTGRYYPNHAGRMLEGAYPIDRSITRQYDPKATPQVDPVFRTDVAAKYKEATPYGSCPPGGTPTSITTQATEHGPMQLVAQPGVLWVLSEFPQTIRWIPTDGRPHSKDPDTSFNGESVAHWEGDTLVVDTIAIDTRMRNISVGKPGDAYAWLHSEKEHVIERFSRPSKNYVTYQVHVEDPEVLTQPFTSAPLTWTLAQGANDNWTEYICSENDEDPDVYKNIDSKTKEEYENGYKKEDKK